MRSYFFSFRFLSRLRTPLKEADVALIQGMWTYPAQMGAFCARLSNTPYLISPRGCLERRSLSEKGWKKSAALALYAKRMLEKATAIHFTSDLERKRSLHALSGTRSFVVENGFLFNSPVQGTSKDSRNRKLRLGIVGRIHPRKGFDVILPALGRLPDKIRLDVIGADENGYREKVEIMARAHGVLPRVTFRGLLKGESLSRAYHMLDYLIVPSHGESFGNTVIEALGLGVPVIVTPRVPVWKFVQENRLGLVTENKVEAWVDVVRTVLSSPTDWDSARLASTVRCAYDFKVKGTQLKNELRFLLGRSSKPVG